MPIIGLELSDAGIVCADGGGLLHTEPGRTATPGFAVIEKGELLLGAEAERRCRLLPRQTNYRFWDCLDTTPIDVPDFEGRTHADMAHAHLARIRDHLAGERPELMIAAPDVFTESQFELLAGIAQALSLPVRGFLSLALASLPPDAPDGFLVHLDLHLHRTVVAAMEWGREAAVLEAASIDGMGMDWLCSTWMKAVGDAFVRRTRFDPHHSAISEQTLYDRLPDILVELAEAESTDIAFGAPPETHRIRFTGSQMAGEARPLVEAILARIRDLRERHPDLSLSGLFATRRTAYLPGLAERIEADTGVRLVLLDEGAAARGALAIADRLPEATPKGAVPFLNRWSRTGDPLPYTKPARRIQRSVASLAPTHLVYRGLAYALSQTPLVVGRKLPDGARGIKLRGRPDGVSQEHFSVAVQDGLAVLTDTSSYGTFVDGQRVRGRAVLAVGQTVRAGSPGEELQVIALCEAI